MRFRQRSDSDQPQRSLFVYLWMLAAAATAVCLAGGPDQGGLGIFLIASGAAMVITKPHRLPDWRLLLLVVAVCGGSLLSFLPQAWFGTPSWRQDMVQNGAIPLAASISLMPHYTLFWCCILAATCAIAVFLHGFPLKNEQLAWLALLTGIIVATYATLAIIAKETSPILLQPDKPSFGFFPNRNHTGTLLTIGALTSGGLAYFCLTRAQYIRGSLACICCLPPIGALLFYSESRAGVLNLGMGFAIWLVGAGLQRLGRRALVIVGVLIVYGIFLFFFEKNPARDRLLHIAYAVPRLSVDNQLPEGADQDRPSLDFRLIIFQDALRLSAAFPVTGVGLGNFQYAVPHYQRDSVREARLAHPESDWLLILTEMGWIPLVALLGAITMLLRRLWNERMREGWPLRWALATAVIVALLHGMIDVPLHRVALGWFVMVLGLAAFTVRDSDTRTRRLGLLWGCYMLIGFAIGTQGIAMVRAEWFGGRPAAPFRWASYDRSLRALGQEHQFDQAERLAGVAISDLPMLDQLYYWRAGYLLTFAGTDAEAAQNFAAARLIDPNSPTISMQEAILWMPIDSTRAAEAWYDAIQRGIRIDRSMGDSSLRTAIRFLGQALFAAKQQPAIQVALLEKIRKDPILLAAWIRYANEDLARSVIAKFSDPTAFFISLPPADRAEMLSRWIQLGNPEPSVNFMESAQAAAPPPGPYWRILSRYYAGTGQAERAVRLAAKAMNVALDASWLQANAAPATLSPFEAELRGVWEDRNDVAARRMIAEVEQAKNADKASLRTVVAFYAANGEWQKAWHVLSGLE